MQHKICSQCKINKPHSDYFKDNRRAIGIRCRCKVCCQKNTMDWREKNKSTYNNYVAEWRAKNPDRQHATEIKRHYGLSIVDYNSRLVNQNCQCAICGAQHNPAQKRGRLYVDHGHTTGAVRGLLCCRCNHGIGSFKENISALNSAIAYLEKNK